MGVYCVQAKIIGCTCVLMIWLPSIIPSRFCCCHWLGFFGLQVQGSWMQKVSLHVQELGMWSEILDIGGYFYVSIDVM